MWAGLMWAAATPPPGVRPGTAAYAPPAACARLDGRRPPACNGALDPGGGARYTAHCVDGWTVAAPFRGG